ncbi:MAG TPA: hypothetical protein EYG74_04240 [Sulfurimonas autotrophica]|nr:hypothetical protein [Sulfurimonas autotrophica]
MKLELDEREVQYLKELFDYTSKVGTNEAVKFEEMIIFDKIKNIEESQGMTVVEDIEQLQKIVKADCGVSETVEDFLKALVSRHPLHISRFWGLDSQNFKAVQILIASMKRL